MKEIKNKIQTVRTNILYVVFALLAVVIPYASNGTVVLLALATLCADKKALRTGIKLLKTPVFLFLLMLFLWAVFSSFWAEKFMLSLHLAGRLVALFLLGLFLFSSLLEIGEEEREKLKKIIICSSAVLCGFYLIDIFTDAAFASLVKGWEQKNLNRIGRGAAVFTVFFLPVVYGILANKKHLFALLFMLVSLFVIVMLPMAAAAVAAGLAIITFVLVYFLKKYAVYAVFGFYALSVLSAPFVSINYLNLDATYKYEIQLGNSWKHRLVIWKFVSEKSMENPVLGHGINSSRVIGEKQEKRLLNPKDPENLQFVDTPLPLHPHNGPLQIWLELGLTGVLFFVGFVLAVSKKISVYYSDSPAQMAVASSSFMAFLTLFSLSFGAWQNWWHAGLWLSSGIAVLFLRKEKAFS